MRRPHNRIPPFVPLLRATMKSDAWCNVSHGARSLFTALKARYNRNIGNSVYLSTRLAASELGSHRDQIGRWFRELDYYGFIRMVSAGSLGVEGRGKAPHWRLTDEPYLGHSPTRDFLHWGGVVFREQKSVGHYVARKQNPGPENRSAVARETGPVVARKTGPLHPPTVPEIRAIQRARPGPENRSITSSPLGTPEKVEAAAALPGASVDPLEIPTFLRRGHPDCRFP